MTQHNNHNGSNPQQYLKTTILLVLLSLFGTASGQPEAGVCACAPYTYGFTLDFNSTCDQSDLVPDDGISSVFCEIAQFGGPGDNITDLVPVSSFGIRRPVCISFWA